MCQPSEECWHWWCWWPTPGLWNVKKKTLLRYCLEKFETEYHFLFYPETDVHIIQSALIKLWWNVNNYWSAERQPREYRVWRKDLMLIQSDVGAQTRQHVHCGTCWQRRGRELKNCALSSRLLSCQFRQGPKSPSKGTELGQERCEDMYYHTNKQDVMNMSIVYVSIYPAFHFRGLTRPSVFKEKFSKYWPTLLIMDNNEGCHIEQSLSGLA